MLPRYLVGLLMGFIFIAKPMLAAEIEVTTRKIESNQTGKRQDRRTIDIAVSKLEGADASILVVWIGDKGDSSKYGIYKKPKRKINGDGTHTFNITYKGKGKFSRNYRGCAVRLVDKNGRTLCEYASITPFFRFLPKD